MWVNANISPNSKLSEHKQRILLSAERTQAAIALLFGKVGCEQRVAESIAAHLVDADLCGVESHGLVRVCQYVNEFCDGTMEARAKLHCSPLNGNEEEILWQVDAGRGSGIPAMQTSVDLACRLAKQHGMGGVALRNVGHTGRLAAFAENVADDGFLLVIIGGGDRQRWRMVAPFGGSKAILPTNPYCLAFPGGKHGAVVLDFATGMLAGGWIYAARAAGAILPRHCLIDAQARPTQDPQDYFDGGAILPKGGALGYGLGLLAELIGEAMLGKICGGESHWLILALQSYRFMKPAAMQAKVEEILHEIRQCPPAESGMPVEIPGERERRQKYASGGKIALPRQTWQAIQAVAQEWNVEWDVAI